MLLPAQQAAGTAATNLMQSMLDSVDKRRAEEDEKTRGKKEDPVLKAQISSDAAMQRAKEKIDAYLFDASYVSTNELKIQLMDRLGKVLGLEKMEDESGYSYGKKLEDLVKDMDYATKRKVEKDSGLADLGISLDTMIAAIKNPYGDDGQALNAALEKQAGGGKDNNVSQSKVMQRLEGIANPKSAEELKLEETQNDPTRVEDDETRAERRQDISDRQAMQKLDDIQDVQKTIKDNRDNAGEAGNAGQAAGRGTDTTADSLQLIQVLAAGAEAAEASAADTDKAADAAGNGDITEPANPEDAAKSIQADAGIDPSMPQDQDAEAQDRKPILTVHVDEIGIYDLLKPKKVA